jgi:hypothetical protein
MWTEITSSADFGGKTLSNGGQMTSVTPRPGKSDNNGAIAVLHCSLHITGYAAN